MSTNFGDSARKGLQIFRGKEGIVKAVYLLAGAGVFIWAGVWLRPYVILAIENTLLLGFLALVLFVAAYVFWSLRITALYALDNFTLKLRQLVIRTDPFSTAQNAIKKLKKRLEEMKANVTKLRGAKQKLREQIDSFNKEREQALSRCELATQQNNAVERDSYANTAKQLREAIDSLQPMYSRADTLNSFLEKMFQVLTSKIAESERSLGIALRTHRIMETGANAVKEAQKVMSGPDQEMFNQAMESISDRTFALVGEVEFFMDMTMPLIATQDFENQARTLDALKEFQAWANKDTELMPKAEKQQLLLEAGDPSLFIPADQVTKSTAIKVPKMSKRSGDKFGLIDRDK